MTVVPLTQAARRLGIDVKTLRRWLAEAQLPLQSDPQDGRTKGVQVEHLHLLAKLHQRHLTLDSSDPSAHEAAPLAPLPAALLALPEAMAALQAQITALQEQVATLTQLLQKPPAPPLTPPASPQKTPTPSARATPPIPKPCPGAFAPNKAVHVIPRVEYRADGCYVVICPKKGLLPLEPDTDEWFAWVKEQESFRFVGKEGHFTAHHWWRVPHGAWRAHRQIRNHSHNVRLAPNHELTIALLEQAAASFQALLS